MRRSAVALFLTLGAACLCEAQYQVGQNFLGTSAFDESALGTWYYPPDTQGVMGNDYFVEVTNSSMAIYDRSGGLQSRAQLSAIVGNSGVGDSRVKYDQQSGRYFVTTTDFGDNLYVGISKTSNPLDGFNFYNINPRTPQPTYFTDFPTLSVTKDTLNISVDLYASVTDFDSSGVNVISIKKSDLLSNTFSSSSFSTNFNSGDRWDKGSFNGVDDLTSSLTDSYLLSSSWWNSNVIHMDTVQSGPGGYTLTDNPDINVGSYTQPTGADQAGTSTLVQTNDSRLCGTPVYQDGKFWAVMNEEVNGAPELQWYEIDPATQAVIDSGTIGGNGLEAYFGSIAVNEYGDVVIGFSGSNSGLYPSAYAVYGHFGQDGLVDFDSPILLKSGTGGNESGRFGDYSETVVDPLNHHHFWTTQEYGTGSYSWGTFVAELTPVPEPATWLLLGAGALAMLLRRRS